MVALVQGKQITDIGRGGGEIFEEIFSRVQDH